jgi:hypothetical protein
VVTAVKAEEVRKAPAPALKPAPTSSGKAPIILLVLLLLAAASVLAFIASKRKMSPSDPISIGVREDGTPIYRTTAEPSAQATPTASATSSARKPKPVYTPPKPKPQDDPYYKQQPPPGPPGPQYRPTEL